MKLKIGPATTVEIRPQTLAFRKEPSLVSPSLVISPSSPSNMQAPPMGKIFSEYFVPPFWNEQMVGPMPTANSTTWMPLAFANRK